MKILILQRLCAQDTIKSPMVPLPDSTVYISEVTISAYRISGKPHTTPGSISVLTSEALRNLLNFSTSDAIALVPGVTMQTGTMITGRLVIRGMGSRTPYNTNRIKSYLNDIPLNSADGVFTPEELDISGMGRIEIIKGPGSAIYGSGLGGSITMFTPRETNNQFNAEARYGSFNTARINISGTVSTGKNIFWVSAGNLSSSGFRENNDYRRTTLAGTHRFEKTGFSLNSTLLFINVHGGIPSSLGKTVFRDHPEKAASNWMAARGYEEYSKLIAAASLSKNITQKLTGIIILFGKMNDNFERRPFNDLDDISFNGGLRYRIGYQAGKTEWHAGGEIIAEQYSWKLLRDTLLTSNAEYRRHLSLFSILNLRPLTKLNVSLALALNSVMFSLEDRFHSDGDVSAKKKFPAVFSPRFGINYAPGDNFAIYASAGHGFSLPSPEETLLPGGAINPDIRPEQGFQYEAGIRINTAAGAQKLDISVYMINLKDLLVTKRITEEIFTGINAGRTRHAGAEISLASEWLSGKRFPGKLSSMLSFTASVNRFINFTDDNRKYDGNYLPGIPFQTLQTELSWFPWKICGATVTLQYTGMQYITDDNSEKYDGYLLAGFKTEFRKAFKKNELNATLGLNNMADVRYASMLIVNAPGMNSSEPRYYYPGMPRNFFAAVALLF